MGNLRAVAIFPNIPAENLNLFKSVAQEMLGEIRKQESILRYDLFFSENEDTCVVLEEVFVVRPYHFPGIHAEAMLGGARAGWDNMVSIFGDLISDELKTNSLWLN